MSCEVIMFSLVVNLRGSGIGRLALYRNEYVLVKFATWSLIICLRLALSLENYFKRLLINNLLFPAKMIFSEQYLLNTRSRLYFCFSIGP